ncbi:heme utilization cystosolic carrier protein HutX [Neorhizobium petrolearium]|uniref:Heme utilization cystosolic carrier protein HutX n=1 Tax=Neorhizobium petrolearium TaxID=515361 RepID=A0ABY8LW40_9HYPH|nr:heme utilization cystosolic carrier protein HutX [Neorhizobium petrolearium]MCC2611359.1 heme utilization cystosolic carrier protein HutX [Neorhizobium petrolearium]WGI66555.1 heme utilization cystosolic carrier protein HutX [Neorhizobium petrolearium]
MNADSDVKPDRRERALAALAEKPDGVVEAIAAKAEVTPAEILEILPRGAAVIVGKDHFLDIWSEMGTWGEVLFIVHTEDIVLEAEGSLPAGSEAHGWFNIHGDSPIGGHIRKDNCASVTFVDRAFHGRRSCSVWFMNDKGSAMFKVFVRRDENRELIAEQLNKFEALRDRYVPA